MLALGNAVRDDAGGLRFAVDGIAGGCEVRLRDLGEWVRVSARTTHSTGPKISSW